MINPVKAAKRHNPKDIHHDDEDFVDTCIRKNCTRAAIWYDNGKPYCERHFRALIYLRNRRNRKAQK